MIEVILRIGYFVCLLAGLFDDQQTSQQTDYPLFTTSRKVRSCKDSIRQGKVPVRAVIFDLGKVLINYDHAITISSVAALNQCEPSTVQAVLYEVENALGTGSMDTTELHRFYQQQIGLSADLEMFTTAFCAGLARNDEALAYAQALQQRPGITVGIISNTTGAHVAWLDEHVPELAELDLVMMSNEVGVLKPDLEIFRLALELLDVPADHTIFIDDLPRNVEAARALGMSGILHTDWAITRPALEAWLATDAG
jgi:FMN phosphatase YigB (HAD superfamily)